MAKCGNADKLWGMGGGVKVRNKNLNALVWPVFIELLMQFLVGNVDQMMIASFQQEAVGALSNANQIMSVMLLTFNMVSMATTILVSQYRGAGDEKGLETIYTLSCALNLVLGVAASVLIGGFDDRLFELMDVPLAFRPGAKEYLHIVGGACVVQSLFSVFLAILRSNQMMKSGMKVSLLINVINVAGNAVLLHGYGPFPALGIRGVAIATVFSQTVGLLFVICVFYKKVGGRIRLAHLIPFPGRLLWQLVRIGIPAGGESFSYDMTQLVLLRFINGFGADSILAKSYCSTISSFSVLYCIAISEVLQIIVGYHVGAKEYDQADLMVKRVVRSSLMVTVPLTAAVCVWIKPILTLFHASQPVVKLCQSVMMIEILRQSGRGFNMVYLRALQGAGDVRYTIGIGILSMWVLVVGGGYMLGCALGWGLCGVWLAKALDELIRGCIFRSRWASDVWKKLSVVQSDPKRV